ncbi:MAG: hypothetical protein Q4E07_03720 [Eubacteriales bacterium]|nr:hypothetical protein [Eubacteriales bacterium]
MQKDRVKKSVSLESFVFLALFFGVVIAFSAKMGFVNFINTFMNTGYELLMDTVLYLTAVAVIIGALSALLVEFGVVSLLNKLLSPVMKPLYGLPGASVMAVMLTYLSDNPAILTLADDENFIKYFKKSQVPALTNLGTSFGMGLIISVFMAGLKGPSGESYISAVLIGNIGTVIGSIVSVRIMLGFTKKWAPDDLSKNIQTSNLDYRRVREGGIGSRFINALMDGGKSGVHMGVAIIPGVIIICSFVMLLNFGMPEGGYTGAAYEGIAFLPWLGKKLNFILGPLLGFKSDAAIAVPITALGSAGAAISLVPKMLSQGLFTGGNIAVFTAMCMCWSGYLSTHVAMMDSLGCPELSGKAILSHTVGGLVAGISAHLIYSLVM